MGKPSSPRHTNPSQGTAPATRPDHTTARTDSWYTPLRTRAFRWLEGAAATSNIGVWMESVMIGYVLAHLTHVPSIVAALPIAASLPGVLFAVPAGALADTADRRGVLLGAKSLYALGMLLLAITALAGKLGPLGILAFTAALGTVGTFSSPAWWATVGDLVPQRMLARALSLDGLQWNVGQVIGPVTGGLLLATLGAGPTFAIAAVMMGAIVAVLAVWRGRSQPRLASPGAGAAEKVVGAMATGARYLTNAPALQVACWRTGLFVLPAVGLTSLLPLFAAKQLGAGPVGYGLLLSAVGVGSIAGALLLPLLHDRYHLDIMVVLATISLALCTTVLALSDAAHMYIAAMALAGTGAAWLMGVTSLNMASREAVPAWVVSRALGAYLAVFQASTVVGALLWGAVADAIGVRMALLVAAASFVPGLAAVKRLGLPVIDRSDMKVVPWPAPRAEVEREPDDGPVMVLVSYNVAPGNQDRFIEVMEELRVVRRRLGASRWGVFEDAVVPGRFVESFVMSSWGEYTLQRSRYTAADTAVYEAALTLNSGETPKEQYFVHPESALAYRRRARWRRLRGQDRALSSDGSMFPAQQERRQQSPQHAFTPGLTPGAGPL